MKIIDLLNKIANNEQIPNKIKYGRTIWYYENGNYRNASDLYFFAEFKLNNNVLNDEVEIIDESNIKYLDINLTSEQQFTINGKVIYKINQLIDEVNKLKENK